MSSYLSETPIKGELRGYDDQEYTALMLPFKDILKEFQKLMVAEVDEEIVQVNVKEDGLVFILDKEGDK